jgi:outer membrane protein TolC
MKLLSQLTLLIYLAPSALCLKPANAVSLSDAIDSAKSNNRNIKLEQLKLKSTKTLKTQAIAEFLPNVKASVQYGNRNSFYQGQTYDRSTKQRIDELTLEQPLFDGLHSVSKYREADYKIKSGSAKTSDKIQEISFAAVEVYCNLYRFQELVKLHQENKDLAKKFLSLVQRRKDVRIIDNSDIIKFNYETSVAAEKYLDALNRLNKAKFDYQNIVGELHENLAKPIISTDELAKNDVSNEQFNREQILEAVQKNNLNIKSYHLNYLASKAAYNAEKSNFLPKVSLSASSSKQTNVVYLNNQDLNSKSLFVNVTVPIFQKGLEFANLSKAGYDKDAALEEFKITREAIAKEVNKALEEYRFYFELNKSNQKLAELSQKRAAILGKRFDAKVEDPIEVIRAKIEANERKINYIDSQMDLVIAHHKIKYFLGEI